MIQPLITITDQEVKNEYYNKEKAQQIVTYKYSLIDFKIKKTPQTTRNIKQLRSAIANYRKSGKLPKAFSELKTQTMDDIPGEGVNKKLRQILKKTPKGGYTPPVLLGSTFHVFFIKSKEQDTTEDFESAKNRIRAKLFNESLESVSKNWFESEARKHYIKFYI